MENRNITLAPADAEKLEMFVSYYNRFSVETIQEKHPGFVVDDFSEVLRILEKILEV